MKYDVILAGVGGQGVLSVAAIIATGAMRQGLSVKQSEVHGMAQRGGAVQAHLRISDGYIPSALIGAGSADMILSMEPLEALRYLDFLKADGVVITSAEPFINIPNYPEKEKVHDDVKAIAGSILVDTVTPAKEAGSLRAANMVLVGAASTYLPVEKDRLLQAIADYFGAKGDSVVETNKKAFELGAAL